MVLKLYYYEHCPYCVRVLAVLNMADVEFDPIVLLNDDEQAPTEMIGQKMLPILEIAPNQYLAESLDIIDYICGKYGLNLDDNKVNQQQVVLLLANIRLANYSLSMPRWVSAPLKEFETASARAYFTEKKTATIGDFKRALANTPQLIVELQSVLEKESELFAELSENLYSKASVILFSGLYGICYVHDFVWPEKADVFMKKMAKTTKLSLLI